MNDSLLLYSVNTKLACLINMRYYGDKHYVWCSPYFDCRKLDLLRRNNPPSSNPYEIYLNFYNDVKNDDKHSRIIQGNREGIIRGAKIQYDKGVITAKQRDDIIDIATQASTNMFTPLIYIIPTHNVKGIVREVPIDARANFFSKENIIEELPRKYFDIIELKE